MSAEIVNLRQARKKKARVEKEAQAAENRILFGQSLAERRHRAATKELQDNKLDGLRRPDTSKKGPSDD